MLYFYIKFLPSRECQRTFHSSSCYFTYQVIGRLEFVIWFVPSLLGGALAVSFVGVFLGPIYPLAMNHTAKILPHSLLTGSIGWIAGIGAAGSACVPFITGAIASKAGIASLQPVYVFKPLVYDNSNYLVDAKTIFTRLIGMMSTMFVLWLIVPGKARRID